MSFQELVLNNIEVMGYNHQNNFFGEKSFHYSTTKTLSIRGYLLDLTNTVGTRDIFINTSSIKNLSQNFYNIIINNINYGIGKIVSLSFDEGNWVRSTQFNADIEIYQEANIQNLVSKEFSGINISGKRFDLIKSFSETFDLDFDQNTKILGGTHSLDIEYNADNRSLNVISLAQGLASELLNKSIPTNLSEYNYSTRQEGTYKVLQSESYDIINGKCGFKKSFSYSTNNNLKPYSINRTLNIELGEDGIVTVQENCDIKAENDNPSLYSNALIGLQEQLSGAYLRCSGLYKDYSSKLNISGDLNKTISQRSTNINKFDGTVSYNINFNNDFKNLEYYTFEYTSILDKSESFIWNVSERGSIQGIGNKNSNGQYSNAQSGWNIVKTGILFRSSGFWNEYAKEKASTSFNLTSKKISRSPYKGEITYDYSYTDDPTIRNDLGNIKRLEIEYTDNSNFASNLLPIYKEFIIPNNLYGLVQNRNLKQQGNFSISLRADVSFSDLNEVFNGFSYFNQLKTIETNLRTTLLNGRTDTYLESADFTSDEIEQSLTYKTNLKYSS